MSAEHRTKQKPIKFYTLENEKECIKEQNKIIVGERLGGGGGGK